MSCKIKIEPRGEETRVFFEGADVTLDESNTELIQDQVLRQAEAGQAQRMVVDLGNVSYLTSSAIGVFLLAHKRLQAAGGHLVLANVQPHIFEIFSITSLNRLLEILPAEVKDKIGK
jgi:anti-anti-sigma factor